MKLSHEPLPDVLTSSLHLNSFFLKEDGWRQSYDMSLGESTISSDARSKTASKLQVLRNRVLEDKSISRELAYYVPPNGQHSPEDTLCEPLQPWVDKEFLKSQAHVLVLKGMGGAGKSTYSRYLQRCLWQDPEWTEWKPEAPPPSAFVPIFIPLGSSEVNPKRLLSYLNQLTELTEPFTDEEINVLKTDYRLLLIADGYDEMPGQPRLNLYDLNGLSRYDGRVKLLISCRSQKNQEKNQLDFMPYGHIKPDTQPLKLYCERYITPWTLKQQQEYITCYLKNNKDRVEWPLWPEIATYQHYFEELPELKSLISSPFLLWIAVETLPTIVKSLSKTEEPEAKSGEKISIIVEKQPVGSIDSASQTEEVKPEVRLFQPLSKDRVEMTRLKLYAVFMQQWFDRQINKSKASRDWLEDPAAILGEEEVAKITTESGLSGDDLSAEYLKQAYNRFCQVLADRLQAMQRISVPYPVSKRVGRLTVRDQSSSITEESKPSEEWSWVADLFGSTSADWQRVRKGCPLRENEHHEHEFWHASFIDYFVATVRAAQPQPAALPMTALSTVVLKPITPALLVESETGSDIQSPLSTTPTPSSLPVEEKGSPIATPIRRRGRLGGLVDPMTQRLLSLETLEFKVDELKEAPKKLAYYEDWVRRAATDKSLILAPINSATVLNLMISYAWQHLDLQAIPRLAHDLCDLYPVTKLSTQDYARAGFMKPHLLSMIDILIHAVRIATASGEHSTFAESSRLAQAYVLLSLDDLLDYKPDFFEKTVLSILIQAYGETHIKVSDVYRILGKKYINLPGADNNNIGLGLGYLHKAIKIMSELYGEDSKYHISIYNLVGDALTLLGKPQTGLTYKQKSLAIALKLVDVSNPDDTVVLLETYYGLVFLFLILSDFKSALEYGEKMLSTFQEKIADDDHPTLGDIYFFLGGVHVSLYNFKKAFSYYEKTLLIYKKFFGNESAIVAQVYNMIGNSYRFSKKYKNALAYHEKGLAINLKKFHTDHLSVAFNYVGLGFTYAGLKDYPNALKYYQKSLPIILKISGNEHLNLLGVYNGLGETYIAIEKSDSALLYLKKSLAISVATYGEENYDTAKIYGLMIRTYYNLLDYKNALACCEKSLPVYLKVYGDEHPILIGIYSHLAVIHFHLGEPRIALGFAEKAIALIEHLPSTEQSDEAVCYKNLAQIRHELGDDKGALTACEKSLAACLKLSQKPDTDPDIANSYIHLGLVHHALGDSKKAFSYQEKALGIFLKAYGDDDLNVGKIYDILGKIHHDLSDEKQSLENYKKSLAIRLKVYGDNKYYAAINYDDLGINLPVFLYNKTTLEQYKKLLADRLKAYGDIHPRVADIYIGLASAYHMLGEPKLALSCQEQARTIILKLYGEEHLSLAVIYAKLSITYRSSLGDIKTAISFAEKALAIRQKIYGDSCRELIPSFFWLSCLYSNLSDKRAIVFAQKSLEMSIKHYGEDHPKTISSYSECAMIYSGFNEHKSSLYFANKSLEMSIKLYGKNHPEVASIYYALGKVIHFNANDYKSALECLDKALEIRLEDYDELGILISEIYDSLGLVYKSIGKFEKSLEYYSKSLEILLKIHGENHENVAKNYMNLGKIYGELGNNKFALQNLQKSLEIFSQISTDNLRDEIPELHQCIGDIYLISNDKKSALECYEKSLGINLKVHGENHPAVAGDYMRLGMYHTALKEYKTALTHFIKALPIALKVHTENAPQLATIYFALGGTYRNLNDGTLSLENNKKSLDIRIKIYGENNPYHDELGHSHFGMALAYRLLANYPSAIEHYQQSLDIRLKNHGEIHEDLVYCHDGLACCYKSTGEMKLALTHHQKSLAILIRLHGEEDWRVGNVYGCLGEISLSLQDLPAALEYYKTALAIQLKTYGDTDEKVINYYLCLSKIQKSLGNLTLSLDDEEKALASKVKKYGDTRQDWTVEYARLGTAYYLAAQAKAACHCYERALAIQLKVVSDGFDLYLVSELDSKQCEEIKGNAVILNNQNTVYFIIQGKIVIKDGRLQTVETIHRQEIALSDSMKPAKYIDSVQKKEKLINEAISKGGYTDEWDIFIYGWLASVYLKLEQNLQKALEYYEKKLASIKACIDLEAYSDQYSLNIREHLKDTYENLGLVHSRLENHSVSLTYYQEALETVLKLHGDAPHVEVALSYNQLGLSYYNLSNFSTALKIFEKAEEICLSLVNDNQGTLETVYYNMGSVYINSGDAKSANNAYQKAITTRLSKINGDTDLFVAISYDMLAMTYKTLEDFKAESECYEKSLAIRLKIQGNSHRDVALIYKKLGLIYHKKNLIEAHTYFQKAIAAYRDLNQQQEVDEIDSLLKQPIISIDLEQKMDKTHYQEVKKVPEIASNHPTPRVELLPVEAQESDIELKETALLVPATHPDNEKSSLLSLPDVKPQVRLRRDSESESEVIIHVLKAHPPMQEKTVAVNKSGFFSKISSQNYKKSDEAAKCHCIII